MSTTSSRSAWATVLLVIWGGIVLLGYQRVAGPLPLATVALSGAWLTIFSLGCLGAGRPLLRWASGPGDRSFGGLLLSLTLGAGVLILAAAGLGAVGWLKPGPLAAVLTLAAGAGGIAAREIHVAGGRSHLRARGPVVLLLVLGVLTIVIASTASPFYDQLHYHLAGPFHWLRAGTPLTWPREEYSFLPANMGLLYAYPLGWLGVPAAQLIHWWMGAMAVAMTATLGSRLSGPRASLWAACFLAASPALLLSATWAAGDLGAAAFGMAAWLGVVGLDRRSGPANRWRAWLVVGALVGLACGCKISAALTVALPVAAGALVTVYRAPLRRRIGVALVVGLGAALVLSPWLIRNASALGNPVYPFLKGTLSHGQGDAPAGTAGIGGLALNADKLAAALTLSTFTPRGAAGDIGPIFLVMLPPAAWFAWRRRPLGAALGVGTAVGIALWAVGPPLGRYLIPVLGPLASLAGAGWVEVRRSVLPTRMRRRLADAGVLVVLVWSALGVATEVETQRLACSLGAGSQDALMRRYASYWPAVRFVNETLPANARLLLVGESRAMYLDRDVDVEDPYRVPLLVELAHRYGSASEMAAALHREGVTHLLINWQEAKRIAALCGRTEYFAPLDAAQRARLDEFLRTELRPLFRERPVEVFALE